MFLAIVWKSFEAGYDIPWPAKVSVFLFGIGILFSVFLYLLEYFGECFENFPHFRKLKEIEDKHGDFLRENDKDAYAELRALNFMMSWSLRQSDEKELPPVIMQLALSLGGTLSLLMSCFLLGLGLFFLGLSVFW